MRIVRREIFLKDLIQGWTVHLPEIGIAVGEHPINAKTNKNLNTSTPDEGISTANVDYVK